MIKVSCWQPRLALQSSVTHVHGGPGLFGETSGLSGEALGLSGEPWVVRRAFREHL